MKKLAYRFKQKIRTISVSIALLTVVIACEKSENIKYPDPSINLVVKQGFVSSDTTISVGEGFNVAVNAQFNGFNRLTNFIVKLNGERYLDLGLYAESYEKEILLTKGLSDVEEWEFIIRDIEGNSSSIGLNIDKNQVVEYGEIKEYSNVKLGAQFNSGFGSFFSVSNGLVYNLEAAYNNSELIDIVYYYDDFDKLEENILASPGANIGETAFPGQYAISNWQTVNTTRYSREKLDVSIADFDNAHNDSILIVNSFAFESGGRKTKFLTAGDIYSFVRGNQTGMFKVVRTSGTTDGEIVIDIKIQD